MEKTGAESCHVPPPPGEIPCLSTPQFPQGEEKNDTNITEMQEEQMKAFHKETINEVHH